MRDTQIRRAVRKMDANETKKYQCVHIKIISHRVSKTTAALYGGGADTRDGRPQQRRLGLT